MIESSLRASCAPWVVALSCLSIGCGGAPPPAPTPPPPPEAPAAATAEPAAPSAAPAASAAPEAPPPPAVPLKTCSKIAAMAPTDGAVWRALVQPGACFTLKHAGGQGKPAVAGDVLVVESYDVRRVDDAEVARLRYTRATPTEQSGVTVPDLPAQVAVTAKGVWLLDRKVDDPGVTKAMAKGPTYAADPRPQEPSKANKWTFVRKGKNAKGDVVCVGREQPKPECTEACASTVCFSAQSGFVLVEGAASPTDDGYVVDEALRPSFEPAKAGAPAKEPKPKK